MPEISARSGSVTGEAHLSSPVAEIDNTSNVLEVIKENIEADLNTANKTGYVDV